MKSTYTRNGVQEHRLPGEHALWQQFSAAETLESYSQHWLALQCNLLAGVSAAVVVTRRPSDAAFTPVAFWPEQPTDRRHLAAVTERASREGRAVALRREVASVDADAPEVRYHLAYPVHMDGRVHTIIGLEMAPRSTSHVQEVIQQLRWGSAWLALFAQGQQPTQPPAALPQMTSPSAPQGQAEAALPLLATLLEHPQAQAAATAFVTTLADRLACERVSLGFVQRGQVRLQTISHSAYFGKKTNLTRTLEAAMDEALDQTTTVVYPVRPEAPFCMTRAHAVLVRQHGTGTVCSIPLARDGAVLGVLTLERPAERPFLPAEIALCEAVAALAGPVLEAQRREDRWLITKAAEALGTQLGRLCGPRHGGRKLVLLLLLALGLCSATLQAEYRVTATTVLEPEVRRVVLAPFDGYIADAPRRAGEVVQAGDVLGILDERDLKLERLKWRGQREQFAKQYQQALAQRNAGLAQVSLAQIAQAEAELALVDEHLERATLRAPFAGLIVSGDLSQAIGAPVERGKVLFEVAPLEAYRVMLEVDERDIADVVQGQSGQLALSAFPHEPLPFTVSQLIPVSMARAGRNYFRVEARFEQTPTRLRPGMEGIGKISIERRLLLRIWGQRVIDWLRLQAWFWLP